MYEVVVVDDEIAVADLMAAHIQKRPGFHVCAVFYDGVSARDYLAGGYADILLTDIQMPDFSGLDLARYASENLPGCAVVLISAFSRFEYARSAIALGVVEYLCKPVTLSEIDRVLLDIAERLETRRKVLLGEEEARQEMRELFFDDLLSGRIPDEHSLAARLMPLGLPIPLNGVECRAVELALTGPSASAPNPDALRRILSMGLPGVYTHLLGAQAEYAWFLLVGNGGSDPLTSIRYVARQTLKTDLTLRVLGACPNFTEFPRLPALAQVRKRLSDDETEPSEAESMMRYILKNLDSDLSRDKVAGVFHMSSAYFSRYFKKACGMSYYDFVRDGRMKRAMELLKSDMQVQKISDAVGYQDRAYFNKVFQLYTGMTPTEYRKRTLSGVALREE